MVGSTPTRPTIQRKVKMKKGLFVLFVLSSVVLFSSISEWNSLNIDPLLTNDPYSYLTYSGSMIEADQFKTITSFDYMNDKINALGMFDNYWGRLGIFIDRESVDMRDSIIKNIVGRDVVPTILGITGGRKVNNFGFGFLISGYRMDEYLTDQTSPYNNTTLSFSNFNLNPSITVNINEILSLDLSGGVSVLSLNSDDVNRVLKVNSPVGYNLHGRVTQSFSENKVILSAKYTNNPFGYEELQQGDVSGDIYLNTADTLAVQVLLSIESFSYVSTYLSALYEQNAKTSKLTFVTGSQSEEIISVAKLPEIATGFSFYVNKFISLNIGVSGCWFNSKIEKAPLLSPIQQTSGFESDFRTGIILSFDNLRIAFDMSKEIVNAPFIISGNSINGLDMNVGISYTGYEF